jgi:hypothetical protein
VDGADLPAAHLRGKTITYTGLTGGVNYADSPYELGDTEARDLLNVVASGRGAIRKRDGCATFATVPSTIHSLGSLETGGGVFLLAGCADGLHSVNVGGTSSLISSVPTDTPWSFAQAPGGAYMSNGVSSPQKWTGAGSGSLWTGTGIPNARFLLYKGTRMWAANMASYGSVADARSCLVYSDLGNPASFPAAGIILFDPNDGEEITGIASLGPYILVAKPSKLWVIYDLDTGANRPLATDVGCASHRSMAEGPGGVWFLANDNSVMVCDGSKVQRISDKIRPLLEQISPVSRGMAPGVFYDKHYYLTVTVPDGPRTLDFDTVLGAWFLHSYAPSDWEVWEPSGEPRLYGAQDLSVLRVWSPGATTDSGVTFESYWRGPYLTFGAPFLNKRVRRIHFDGTGRIRVGLSRDFAGSVTHEMDASFGDLGSQEVWGQGSDMWGQGDDPWGGTVEVGEAEVLTPGVARAWSVQFGNQTPEAWEVNSYTLAVTGRRD